MPWIEAHVTTPGEHADELSDQLIELGAQAITYQDAGNHPIFEPTADTPRIWHETVVVGLFDSEQSMEPVVQFLEAEQALGIFNHFHLHHVADEDWVRRSLDSFKPIQCGKRLWICPSWHTPPAPDSINVILDPGLAFGTGTHPTTALCLQWLDENISGEQEVIDYGCGSGILAIAALKLGAKHAICVDHDPEALKATHENAQANHLTPEQLETLLPTEHLSTQADLLIANILAQPLMELAPLFANLTRSGSKIVLSGILKNQANDVVKAYNPWFNIEKLLEKEEWICLAGVRK